MSIFLSCCICFFASIIGAICGIGGGIIIKPVLDAFGIMSVDTISFLSGCTVLAMTTYSVIQSKISGSSAIETRTGLPLALGAALGGIAGKQIFSMLCSSIPDIDRVGAIQAICLLVITAGTLVYTIKKDRITALHVSHIGACIVVGASLGILSSFLGIGGGPINLVVLFYFFSMDTKTAAENSLYIIFFSQAANLLFSLLTGSVPDFPLYMLVLMVICGIAGGAAGRSLNRRIQSETVDRLFIALMLVIIIINIYNIYKFM